MIIINDGLYQFGNFKLSLNVAIEKGDFCAVLGPSGAGKSTMLSLIAGFEKLNQGEIFLDGKPAPLEPSQRKVSMIFQDHNTFAHLNIWTNVALGISPDLKLSDEQKMIVSQALSRVGLEKLENRKPGEISGGELQRIALARALVRNQPILLLDEPFASLDPGLRKNMLNLVSEIQKERNLTVLLVTHQPDDAKLVAQKVIFVENGFAHNAVATELFFNNPSKFVKDYLGT